MKVRVLGCDGGIGKAHSRTTSLLLDHDILIDAGTGLSELDLASLARIDHVFLTHAHVDHIANLPLLLDSVANMRVKPVKVYALEATLSTLRRHVFNGIIWPDFSQIAVRKSAVFAYQPVCVGQKLDIDHRSVTVLPAEHIVPAVGYLLDSGCASLAFSGDTSVNDTLWEVLNKVANLRYLLIETAFSNNEAALAQTSKHLCPNMLNRELAKFRGNAEIYISHLKPKQANLIMAEIKICVDGFSPHRLKNNHVFEF